MSWQCPHCNTENPDNEPICRVCDEQRVISGGGTMVVRTPKPKPEEDEDA